MRRVFSLVFLVAVALVSMPPPVIAQAPDLAGLYTATGTSAEGKAYTATLELLTHGDVYYAVWTFPEGPPAKGVGLVHSGVLAIAFVMPWSLGIVLYPIENGAITRGTWTGAGEDRSFAETLTKLPADHPPPVAPVAPVKPAGRLLQS